MPLVATRAFLKAAKRLVKKYPSLKAELQELEQSLLANPRQGTMLRPGVYKIRVAVKSKGKGKSGGLRVITHLLEINVQLATEDEETTLFLVFIYDKSEQESMEDSALMSMIEEIHDDLDREENS